MQGVVLVGIGGALGAVLRYLIGVGVTRVWTAPFPLATLLINIAGSLAMGVLVGALGRSLLSWTAEARLFLGIGILGGFTTFSSFSLDVVTLLQRGLVAQALAYVLLSVAVSVLALYLGLMITKGFAP